MSTGCGGVATSRADNCAHATHAAVRTAPAAPSLRLGVPGARERRSNVHGSVCDQGWGCSACAVYVGIVGRRWRVFGRRVFGQAQAVVLAVRKQKQRHFHHTRPKLPQNTAIIKSKGSTNCSFSGVYPAVRRVGQLYRLTIWRRLVRSPCRSGVPPTSRKVQVRARCWLAGNPSESEAT